MPRFLLFKITDNGYHVNRVDQFGSMAEAMKAKRDLEALNEPDTRYEVGRSMAGLHKDRSGKGRGPRGQ